MQGKRMQIARSDWARRGRDIRKGGDDCAVGGEWSEGQVYINQMKPEPRYVEAIGRNPGEEYQHSHLYVEVRRRMIIPSLD